MKPRAWQGRCYKRTEFRMEPAATEHECASKAAETRQTILVMRVQIGKHNAGRNPLGGFSLIEAAIGMAVVGIVCVALYSGLTSGLATVRLSRQNERATQIMTEKLDTIRLYSWDKITTPNYIPTNFTKLYDPKNQDGITYNGSVTIGKVPIETPYSTNMRLVTVTLEWKTGALSRQRSMTTMVAKDGMQNYIY